MPSDRQTERGQPADVKRLRPPSRTEKQKAHAQIRAKQRLGFMLTHTELKQLAQRVRMGTFVRPGMHGREVWRCQVRGIECEVVFDPARRHVVSFLPVKSRDRQP